MLTYILVSAIAISLFKLGAVSLWAAILALSLKFVLLVVVSFALSYWLRAAWRRRNGSGN